MKLPRNSGAKNNRLPKNCFASARRSKALARQASPSVVRKEHGGGLLLVGEVDDVVAIVFSGLAENGLRRVVVRSRLEAEFAMHGIGPVAGEGASGLLDIGLGVVALAEEKKLEQFAGKVFVRRLFLALLQVEVDDHRG